MKRFIPILLLLVTSHIDIQAQELNCQVTINIDQVQDQVDEEMFNTLQQSVTEYMNDRKWSNAQISIAERINCAIYITIKSIEDSRYVGDIQIQASRPVYNTSYTTTTFNFKDSEFSFTYQEYEPLVYNDNMFENNLTCVLNFYAYLILGIDFDTFSPRGGDVFFRKAETFAIMGQSSQEAGWQTFGSSRNRSAIISSFTEERLSPYREMMYKYHRLGLDQMSMSPDKGRKVITQALQTLKEVYSTNSMSVLLPIFSDSKLDELVNLYSEAPQQEREDVYKLLSGIYPTEGQRLQQLRKGKTD